MLNGGVLPIVVLVGQQRAAVAVHATGCEARTCTASQQDSTENCDELQKIKSLHDFPFLGVG
jgi:non-ribosomal peptide synthetase component E (peptide arylation enzyme)